MGRHKKSVDRPIVPDGKYNSKVITKFVKRMMLDGKKETCTKIVYEAMDKLKSKTDKDPLEVLYPRYRFLYLECIPQQDQDIYLWDGQQTAQLKHQNIWMDKE